MRVKGQVQGVGYRYFVTALANKLSLTGWIRNCSNGDVEGEAQGDDRNISDFLNQLLTGHQWARVDDLKKETVAEKSTETGFEVRI